MRFSCGAGEEGDTNRMTSSEQFKTRGMTTPVVMLSIYENFNALIQQGVDCVNKIRQILCFRAWRAEAGLERSHPVVGFPRCSSGSQEARGTATVRVHNVADVER